MMYRDISPGACGDEDSVTEGRKVVAVGIDRCRGWHAVSHAVSGAQGALRAFQHLGFEQLAPLLIDETATGDAIRRLVTDDLAALSSNYSEMINPDRRSSSRVPAPLTSRLTTRRTQ